MNDTIYNELVKQISSQYAGCVILSRAQTTKILGIGLLTLDLRIADGRDVPRFVKMGSAKNSRIMFNIPDIASYIFLKRIQTI